MYWHAKRLDMCTSVKGKYHTTTTSNVTNQQRIRVPKVRGNVTMNLEKQKSFRALCYTKRSAVRWHAKKISHNVHE